MMCAVAAMSRAEMQARALSIAGDFGAELRLDEPLGPLVSMRVGGTAAALLLPRDTQGLAGSVARLGAERVPFRLLGGGSNLLIADGPVDLVVVSVASATGAGATWQGSRVRAPGGLPLGQLVSEAARRGLSGLEWAAGLPGSVGGAVFGNAGAFGGEIAASVAEIVLMSSEGSVRTHVPAEGDFRYRRSFVLPGELILEIVLQLAQSSPEAVRAETNRVNRARAGSQPKGGHSSGCVFKNPLPLSAGRLIDECGLKGMKVGGAQVSPAHGNFIINDGTATAGDIAEIIRRVRAEVLRQRGVELEIEVQIWPSHEAIGIASADPMADDSPRGEGA